MPAEVIGRAGRQDNCDSPLLMRNTRTKLTWVQRCDSKSARVCLPCAETYRRRVWRIADSGRLVRLPGDSVAMLTLTAPSDVDQHCMRHKSCDGRASDECVVCPCSPAGGVHLGVWNADCSKRLNRLIEDVRRMTGVPVQYFRAAEIQRRGALHFHLILRMPKSRGMALSSKALRELALKHGFGHEARLDPVDSARAASYVAKYVSKSCAERSAMPWVDRRSGEVCSGNGRYRVWTCSRKWGLTMARLRAEQAAWWSTKQALAAGDPAGAGCRPAGPGPAAAGPLDLNSQSYATGQLSLLEGVGL